MTIPLLQSEQTLVALISAVSGLTGGLVSGCFMAYAATVKKNRDETTLLSALAGELSNVLLHYKHNLDAIATTSSGDLDLSVKIQFMLYGDLHYDKNVGAYGFLPAEALQTLLQLTLKIRNNDIFCKYLLERGNACTQQDLDRCRQRFEFIIASTKRLMDRLLKYDSRLRHVFKALS